MIRHLVVEQARKLVYLFMCVQVEDEWQLLTKQAESAQPAETAAAPPANGEATPMETDGLLQPGTEAADQAEPSETPQETPLTPQEAKLQDQRQKLSAIMRGETSVQLYLEFLHSHNHADLQVLLLWQTACLPDLPCLACLNACWRGVTTEIAPVL